MIIYSLLFFVSSFAHDRASDSNKHTLVCTPEYADILATLRQLPEVESLVEQILGEGSFKIMSHYHLSKEFKGYWSPDERTIYLTPNAEQPLSTLLFEMHNALRNKEFCKLDQLAFLRKITRNDYIEQQEYLEYQNALETAALLEKGIEQNLFPKDASWDIVSSFKRHFQMQQSSGHSNWIGRAYDKMQLNEGYENL